jgi:hypothetical protein
VRDSHFDRTLNGVNWDAVNDELRPKAVAARTVGELRALIRDMLGLGRASRCERDAGLRRASGRARSPGHRSRS